MLMNPYDEVPYKSYPFPQSHPARLATVGTLFGMRPAELSTCRVLELGCSSGGNLIPLADQYPDGEFVGIDFSQVELEEGWKALEPLGLKNIQLLHQNILDVTEELGQFDYIIAHGIYSWIPDPVQDKLLQVCRANLKPQGIAYVSYNTYPGWHMREMVRNVMAYRAQFFEKPSDRLRQARQLVDFLAHTVPTEGNAYGLLLKNELEMLADKDDYYLFHDYLEEINSPIYFHEFMQRAQSHQLQYLGESDFSVMWASNFPKEVEAMLQNVASDVVEMEQYMDFVRNRMFRQTLLCHANVNLDRTLAPDNAMNLHVATSAKSEDPFVDVHARDRITFRGSHSVMTTNEPLVKAAMLHLAEQWPHSVGFAELLARARSRLNPSPVVVDTSRANWDARKLAEPMMRCYATSLVELSVRPSPFILKLSERPQTSRLARYQASIGNTVTNLCHEVVHVNDLQRHLLQHLDGDHDRQALIDLLWLEVQRGHLSVHDQGRQVKSEARIKEILAQIYSDNMKDLARRCLLVPFESEDDAETVVAADSVSEPEPEPVTASGGGVNWQALVQ